MKILIVEDDAVRQKKFAFNLASSEVVFTDKPKIAIERLQNETWDVLFLDHDLEGPFYCASGPGTGYEVAEWLSQHSDRQPKYVFTHSYNQPGVKRICGVLPSAIYFPYAWEESALESTLKELIRVQKCPSP